MSMDAVSGEVVAIYLDNDEMGTLGYELPLSAPAAREVVRDYLRARGEEPWTEMEVDLFGCEGALLLLARPSSGEWHCFSFHTCDAMLAAAVLVPPEIPSKLTYIHRKYLLSLRCGFEAIPSALFEYGEHDRLDARRERHLQEHGKIIIPSNAAAVLRTYFAF